VKYLLVILVFLEVHLVPQPSNPQDTQPPDSQTLKLKVKMSYNNHFRIGLWHPLIIEVSAENGFTGELQGKTDSPVIFSKKIFIPPKSTEVVILPVIFFHSPSTLTIFAVQDGKIIAQHFYEGNLKEITKQGLLVGIEEKCGKYSGDITIDNKPIAIYTFNSRDAKATEELTKFEAVDIIVQNREAESFPLAIWKSEGGVLLHSIKNPPHNQISKIKIARHFTNAQDFNIFSLYKENKWVETKRTIARFLIIVYSLVIIAFLILLWRVQLPKWKIPKFQLLWVGTLFLSIFSGAIFILLVPSGNLSAQIYEFTSPNKPNSVVVQFIKADKPCDFLLKFNYIVKPILYYDKNTNYKILINDDGSCEVKITKLKEGQVLCFVSEPLSHTLLSEKHEISDKATDREFLRRANQYISKRFGKNSHIIKRFISEKQHVSSDQLSEAICISFQIAQNYK